ncbi:HepT-like ribonuclease domain-containing protein [Roseiflexus sp.]|uniref:HepT-like ribonuclease domain-containing protein n=1 Tax=Roseiflexus sp. TaxID=2562120 RepID=UPI00398B65CE
MFSTRLQSYMRKYDDRVSLSQMLEYARQARKMVTGFSRSDLDTNDMLRYATTYLIQVIGESARRVSASVRTQYPQIPWSDIIGMRNRLAHGYDEIDLDLLWDTIMIDLPPLIAVLESIPDIQEICISNEVSHMALQIDIPYDEIAAFCRRWRVKELSIFGSDDFRPDSDKVMYTSI